MQSGLLWYKIFSERLKGHGFVLNPYNICVGNKIIDGKQCSIIWYVVDLKISHVKCAVMDDIIRNIVSHFGEMTIT